MKKQIQAVLFDLDGTLRFNVPTGDQIFVEFLTQNGETFTHEDIIHAERWEHYYFAHSPEIQSDFETHKDTREFWVNFSRRRMMALGFDGEKASRLAPTVSAHMAEAYKPTAHVPKEAFALLASLKESGYVLGVVSNRDEPFKEELKDLKLDPYFDFALAGGEVKSFKPDSRIFEHALTLAGTTAAEAAYVGDNYYADIVGSLRAGLMPVLYDPRGLFPEAECAIIRSHSEIHELLK